MRIDLRFAVLATFMACAMAPAQHAPVIPTAVDRDPRGSVASKIHPAVDRVFVREQTPTVKVWVFFEDGKGSNAAARAGAGATAPAHLNQRAVRRRQMRRTAPGVFDARDLPVPQNYIDGVRQTGATVKRTSRWLNAVSAYATPQQVRAIAELPYVKKIQPVRRGKKIEPAGLAPPPLQRGDRGGLAETAGGASRTGDATGSGTVAAVGTFYGLSEAQLAQINLINLHNAGFTGDSVVVGVLDTGFHRTHEAFNEPGHVIDVIAEYDFINDDGNTAIELGDNSSQHAHGTLILGVLGAYNPDTLVGGAFDASFILCKTEDVTSETPVEEDNYVAGLEFIEQNGGDLATSSLGYIDWYTQEDLDGMTAVTTIAVNTATQNGLHCLTAAGNGGHDSDPATSQLLAPADALAVITCGAADLGGNIAGFSSDGPSADGRVKPEVLACGLGTQTVDPFNDTSYVPANGTSLSTPVAAAAVACLVQAHPTWTVHQMRRYLMFTASDYVLNGEPDPLFIRGYGIINAASAAAEDCNANSVSDATDIATGESFDCNGNFMPDECDISQGFSEDTNSDNIPDECPGLIPAVSSWGLVCLALLLLCGGTVILRQAVPQSRIAG